MSNIIQDKTKITPIKNGRPRKEFDQDVFEKLCGLQCTQEEIANWFDMCRDTLITRIEETYNESFSTAFKKFSDEGRMSLRRYQFQMAKTNTTMAIWLGKQYLGQKDENYLRPDGIKKIVIEYIDDIKIKSDECIPTELAVD